MDAGSEIDLIHVAGFDIAANGRELLEIVFAGDGEPRTADESAAGIEEIAEVGQ